MEAEKFDLDIYGDDTPQEVNTQSHSGAAASTMDKENAGSTSAKMESSIPAKPAMQKGTKRKELPDDRPIDQNAALALLITDLHWWITEDDVRGWANQAGCEEELKDLGFNEHKVNGKSKGYVYPIVALLVSVLWLVDTYPNQHPSFNRQVYIEFSSLQASTAVKRVVELSMQDKQPGKKFTTSYHHMAGNPYRTLPKDIPGRRDQRGSMGTHSTNTPSTPSFGQGASTGGHSNFGSFRGRGGFQGPNRGGFQNFGQQGMPPQPNNFPNMFGGAGNGMNPMQPQMNSFGGFNRGGMMGGMPPRGGMAQRGGRGNMPMGGMMNPMMGGMGGMGMGMPMGVNMGMMNPMMGSGSMPMSKFFHSGGVVFSGTIDG